MEYLDAHAAGVSAWPHVHLTYEELCQYVTRCGYGEGLRAHPADLYLCAACALGHQSAYRAIEKTYFPKLSVGIYRMVKDTQVVGEVLQELRSRLFVGHLPKIATYKGSGTLCGWLCRVAMCVSSNYLRAAAAQRRLRSSLEQCVSVTHVAEDSPDERTFRNDRRRSCEQAWLSAVHSLDATDRQLLHRYFVAGLSIDRLGPLYSVHRATIARRIRRTTEHVRRQVRASLSSCYPGWNAQDLDALALGVCRELDVSASLLRPSTKAVNAKHSAELQACAAVKRRG